VSLVTERFQERVSLAVLDTMDGGLGHSPVGGAGAGLLGAGEPELEVFLGNTSGLGGDVRESAGADEGANVALVLGSEVDGFAGHVALFRKRIWESYGT